MRIPSVPNRFPNSRDSPQMDDPGARRPSRWRILDELGRPRTLDSRPLARLWDGNPEMPPLLLGLGPDPSGTVRQDAFPVGARWLECPDFSRQLPESAYDVLPANWKNMEPSAVSGDSQAEVWAYLPGLRLFSAFWGPLLGRLRLERMRRGNAKTASRAVLLPGDERGLLTFEMEEAFRAEGFAPIRLPLAEPEASQAVARFLASERPSLFFSVNLRGLDPEGASFYLLQAAGVPVAVWFVDNPWHVLCALRRPWWKQARLFVTDSSFIPSLLAHGAQDAVHLPLAAWYARVPAPAVGKMPPVVFVGRSAFPDKSRFFAGCRIPPDLFRRAAAAGRPDFVWWAEALGLKRLWPGNEARAAGMGAEECSLARRQAWLTAAAVCGLAVYGDKAWKELLPSDVEVRSPVDYYTALPGIYAAAPYSLNVTSLLLPSGLTQRHFDVWAAGGFLLSDATPGLEIFPDELVRPVALSAPSDLAPVLARFENDPALKRDLAAAWRKCIASGHTCRHRIRTVCERLDL